MYAVTACHVISLADEITNHRDIFRGSVSFPQPGPDDDDNFETYLDVAFLKLNSEMKIQSFNAKANPLSSEY